MKKSVLFFLWIGIPLICLPQKRKVVLKSTIKLEGKSPNIRDFLEIDGYYEGGGDSKMIFFEDGTFAPVSFKEGATKEMIKENLSKWIDSGGDKKSIGWGNYYYDGWGIYRIEGDTIIGQCFKKGTLLTNWTVHEKRYKIVNRRTIQLIYREPLMSSDDKLYKNTSWWVTLPEPFRPITYFIPADSLPPSDCWLKEEKWIWRNEQNWKDYKEKIKLRKKRKKN